jgi:hypothetical protein
MNLIQLNNLIYHLEMKNDNSYNELINFYYKKKQELIKEISQKVNQILKSDKV